MPLLWLFLAATASGQAADIQKLARAVDDHYNHLRSLESDFTEIYRVDGAERVDWAACVLKAAQDAVRIPFSEEKLFVSDGQAVWLYLPADGNVRSDAPEARRPAVATGILAR